MAIKQLPKETYSAYELAEMKLPGFPHTAKGWYQFVAREKWTSIEAVASGRGRKGGVRMEFYPTPEVIELIEKLQETDEQYLTQRDDFSEPGVKQDTKPYPMPKRPAPEGAIEIEYYPGVHGSAGPGLVTPTDQVVVNLAINAADWNRYVGLDSHYVKLVKVFGDSMKPILNHGDQTLVDTACKQFIDDAIYCIAQGDLLRFKRIKLQLDGKVIVKSDNEIEGFPPEIYTADEAASFHVIGRVIPLKFGWFEI